MKSSSKKCWNYKVYLHQRNLVFNWHYKELIKVDVFYSTPMATI